MTLEEESFNLTKEVEEHTHNDEHTSAAEELGDAVVDTVQTGVIIGAFPFAFVILLMIANLFRRLKTRNKAIKKLEKEVNDPNFREEDLLLDEHGVPLVVHSDNKES